MFKNLLTALVVCLGVNLALTADLSNGPNHLQAAPKLTSAHQKGVRTKVEGELKSVKNTRFVIQFFNNPVSRSDNTEGLSFLGEIEVKTDKSGKASFETLLPATGYNPRYISATATRINDRGHKTDTSEFSKNVKVHR